LTPATRLIILALLCSLGVSAGVEDNVSGYPPPPNKPLINKTLRKHGEQPRRFVISTNAPAWGLLMINAEPEITIKGQLSASLPLYYSGFNYFRGDLKFRTFTLQPTLRVWLGKSWVSGFSRWVGKVSGV